MNSSLFPELGETPGFPEPDVVANLDVDRLSRLPDAGQDFVIASHVLEHLANPLAMLVDIHRVLRTGGLLVLLIPDRHKTFDRERSPTPLSHLIDEYRRDVREVDDAHIVDFLIGTSGTLGDDHSKEQFTSELTAEEIQVHRQRSVHAHVWDADEFGEVMDYAANELGLRWDVVDTMPPGAEGTYGDEFGWVLSKAADNGDPPGGSRRFWRMPRPANAFDRGRWRSRLRRRNPGFNIIGHFSDTSGLAEATKSTARCVAASGYPMNLVDVGPHEMVDERIERKIAHHSRPFWVNIVHDNVFHARNQRANYYLGNEPRFLTVGYWYWEQSLLPVECATAFDLVDEVWVPSRFVFEALRPHTEKPVIVVPPSVDVEMGHATGRARFELPPDRFLFLAMASVHSVLERKNPMGVVEAFERAFDRGDDVGLVIKITDRHLRPDIDAALVALAQRLPIFFVDERLPRNETLGLIACCDCYVSLHRGEGFGLPIAEAMALGKPVIVTAYSGNLDITNEVNSYLVDFDLVELEEDLAVYPKGSTWAEPRLDEAVAQMRSVAFDSDRRARTEQAGKEFVVRHFAPGVGGAVIRDRMHHFEALS